MKYKNRYTTEGIKLDRFLEKANILLALKTD
jgi:hypothetical protein